MLLHALRALQRPLDRWVVLRQSLYRRSHRACRRCDRVRGSCLLSSRGGRSWWVVTFGLFCSSREAKGRHGLDYSTRNCYSRNSTHHCFLTCLLSSLDQLRGEQPPADKDLLSRDGRGASNHAVSFGQHLVHLQDVPYQVRGAVVEEDEVGDNGESEQDERQKSSSCPGTIINALQTRHRVLDVKPSSRPRRKADETDVSCQWHF